MASFISQSDNINNFILPSIMSSLQHTKHDLQDHVQRKILLKEEKTANKSNYD